MENREFNKDHNEESASSLHLAVLWSVPTTSQQQAKNYLHTLLVLLLRIFAF